MPQRQYRDFVGEGMQQFGGAALHAGIQWGDIAADDMANQFQESANKLLYGDPTKKGADGTPDTGYLGLKGRAALDQREAYEKKFDDLEKTAGGKMVTPLQQARFSSYTRRYRQVVQNTMGRHATTEANAYTDQVTSAQAKLSADMIAAHPEDPDTVAHAASDIIDAYVKQAQLRGAQPDDALYKQAIQRGHREAIAAQTLSIGVNDPGKALRIIENNKETLGTEYDNLAQRFRARAQQQHGVQVGDSMLSGAPPPAGDDAKAVLRHFEGFREEPYWDVNHWRVGYGSDTITKADGTVDEVKPGMKVSREDAERDLDRRSAISQKQVVDSIGQEAWDKLDAKARASMVSVTYNYGSVPAAVATAAATGDREKIAQAIRSLSGHNGGVNAGRRASEANNIMAGGKQQPRTQGELIQEIQSMHMDPQAEAAAIARVTHSYALRQDTMTRDRAAFKVQTDNARAEALNTGVSSKPIPPEEFNRHYGPHEGPAKYEEYIADVQYGAQYHAMQEMPNSQMDQVVTKAYDIPAGAPNYNRQLQNAERLRKGAEILQKERQEDPAGAVSRKPAVADALKTYDPQKPETFQLTATARLEAQAAMGIEPEYRSPITKREALQMTAPLKTMLPGQERDTLNKVAQKFQAMFGPEADRAFGYALRTMHAGNELQQKAASVAKKLGLGQPVTRDDARGVDQAKEADAAERAVTGTTVPRSPRAQPRVVGNGEASTEPSNGPSRPSPSPKALSDLFGGVLTDQQFDSLYGTGRAKEIRKRYPAVSGGGSEPDGR